VLAVCERALGALESLGAEIIEVETVFDEDPMAPWLSMVGACLLRTMGPHRSSEAWSEVDPVLAMVVEQARSLSAVELIGVFDECHRLNLRLVELFHDVRLLVTPTWPLPASHLSWGSRVITVRRTSTGSASLPLQHDTFTGRHRLCGLTDAGLRSASSWSAPARRPRGAALGLLRSRRRSGSTSWPGRQLSANLWQRSRRYFDVEKGS